MGLFDALSSLFSGNNTPTDTSNTSTPSKSAESKEVFRFKQDNKDGGFRQDKFTIIDKETGGHEHTWSKTSTDGQHKEGWVGSEADRSKEK